MYGMGTYIVVVPVFSQMPDVDAMYINKLCIEHHAIPGSFISYIYNQSGGGMVKWFKNTLYSRGQQSIAGQKSIYDAMFAELPDSPNDIIVIAKFGATGAPDFLTGNQGCIYGLSLSNTRGDILRALLEGVSFYIRDFFEDRKGAFTDIDSLTATGGGSVSDKWLQITSDILGKPIVRNKISEASSLGAAIIAGVGSNVFSSFDEAIDSMVHKDLIIYPDDTKNEYYTNKYKRYRKVLRVS